MDESCTIYVNARFLNQRTTGVQRFAMELSLRLKRHYGDKIQFITHPGIIHTELIEELEVIVIGKNKSHLWEQIDLYRYLLSRKKPLLISFGYTGPLLYKNQIVTIHDMCFKYYKKTYSKLFVLVYNFLVPRIAKRCLHLFTVSESSKLEIIKELNIEKDKISVIYNGISSIFKNKIKQKDTNEAEYILTVSSHHPRKNYRRLVEAFLKVSNPDIKLYIVGNKTPHFSNDLVKYDYGLHKRIVFLNNVSDEQLARYYEKAKLFVFVSLYEGFGIPVIEAMSMGKLCVLSDISVFKEIGDNQVIYVDPYCFNSITRGIEKGLGQKDSKLTYPMLNKFSWDKSAKKVISIIESKKIANIE